MLKEADTEIGDSAPRLAKTLARMRSHSGLTQKQVAERAGTTQAAIARLERGKQSPNVRTLQNVARANGFCLEIGFVRSPGAEDRTGCILIIDDAVETIVSS
ncbi:MAG: helix-turn-helix transcriptional regulator [Beijerinckiaceae bacterium]|nr:helix-turn-helix transcriptional regulator [Beijerinckiaceae bacterium]